MGAGISNEDRVRLEEIEQTARVGNIESAAEMYLELIQENEASNKAFGSSAYHLKELAKHFPGDEQQIEWRNRQILFIRICNGLTSIKENRAFIGPYIASNLQGIANRRYLNLQLPVIPSYTKKLNLLDLDSGLFGRNTDPEVDNRLSALILELLDTTEATKTEIHPSIIEVLLKLVQRYRLNGEVAALSGNEVTRRIVDVLTVEDRTDQGTKRRSHIYTALTSTENNSSLLNAFEPEQKWRILTDILSARRIHSLSSQKDVKNVFKLLQSLLLDVVLFQVFNNDVKKELSCDLLQAYLDILVHRSHLSNDSPLHSAISVESWGSKLEEVFNLDPEKVTKYLLAHPENVRLIMAVIETDKNIIRTKLLKFLQLLVSKFNIHGAVAPDYVQFLRDTGVLKGLIKVAKDSYEEAGYQALKVLSEIARMLNDAQGTHAGGKTYENIKKILASDGLGLLPVLTEIIRNAHGAGSVHTIAALSLLRSIGIEVPLMENVKAEVVSETIKLLSDGQHAPNVRVAALMAIRNIAGTKALNKKVLLESQYGLCDAIESIVSGKELSEEKFIAWQVLHNIAEDGIEHEVIGIELTKHGFHHFAVAILRDANTNVATWDERHILQEIALHFIMSLARFSSTHKALKSAKALSVVRPFYDDHISDAAAGAWVKIYLKAMFAVMFLVGKNEERHNQPALLNDKPHIRKRLFKDFGGLLNFNGTNEKSYFSLQTFSQACNWLAISDSNKKALIQKPKRLIKLLVQTLHDYARNLRPLKTKDMFFGGVDEDKVSVQYAIETLLLLLIDDDEDDENSRTLNFLKSLTNDEIPTRHIEVDDLRPGEKKRMRSLSKIFDTLLEDKQLNKETKLSIGRIMDKLDPSRRNKKVSEDHGSTTGNTISSATFTSLHGSNPASALPRSVVNSLGHQTPRTHVMISYSWTSKELVKKLASALRKYGYDVWRDEDGSTIVPVMAGSVNDRMAEATEKASVFIMCVSREYKESANCRGEADYASKLLKKKKLNKIIPVMIQEDYTPEHDSFGGWVGFLCGTDLWYPLQDSSHVEKTSERLNEVLRDYASSACLHSDEGTTTQHASADRPEGSLVTHSSLSSSASNTTSLGSRKRDSSAVSSAGEHGLQQCWDMLQDSRYLNGGSVTEAKGLLNGLGITDSSYLQDCCEVPSIMDRIVELLLPAPQVRFKKLMGSLHNKK